MHRWLLTLLLAMQLQATDVASLIEEALRAHPSLEAIKSRIAAAEFALQRAKNFDDPMLTLSINDIRLDKPTDRELEPMQYDLLMLAQKLPWFGKREAKRDIAQAKRRLRFTTLEAARIALAERIKIAAYRVWAIEKQIGITTTSIRLSEQSIGLNEAYAATDSGQHMGIMSAELLHSRQQAHLAKLHAARQAAYALLSYLGFAPVTDLHIDLGPVTLPKMEALQQRLARNPQVAISTERADLSQKEAHARQLQTYADPILQAGYYHRSAYEDFVSLGLGFALPLYGTQKSLAEEARAMSLAEKSLLLDKRLKVRQELETLYARLLGAHAVIEILHRESLPQVAHMFDLVRSDITSGGDLYRLIDLIEQKLRLDTQLIDATEDFHVTKARIEALLGGV